MGLNWRESCREHFVSLGVLTVYSLYVLDVVMRSLDSHVRLGFNHEYITRYRNKLLIPRHNTSRFEIKPSYMGVWHGNSQNYKHLKLLQCGEQNKKVIIEENPGSSLLTVPHFPQAVLQVSVMCLVY
jgi:hypothetical protein